MLPKTDSFQDRTAYALLEQTVAKAGTAVLVGMGGVGKTQLAARYARHALKDGKVDLLLWVTATSRPAIIDALAEAAAAVLGVDTVDGEQAAGKFLAWLEPKHAPEGAAADSPRWLIILDDLADPADVRGMWPSTSPIGQTVATTRRRDAVLTGPSRRPVAVGIFTADEAVDYLTTTLESHARCERADQLAGLSADLGYLPLALSQAVAYIVDAGLSCADYRTLLADRARTLTDLLPEPGALPDGQSLTVAAAWSLSIERADRLRPRGLARATLQLAAMLDPNGIPAPLFTSRPTLAYLTSHQAAGSTGFSRQNPAKVTEDDAVGALRALHRLSLIDHNADTPHQAVRVHNLIQRAVREPLPKSLLEELALTAADALTASWPDIERDTTLAQALRANTNSLTQHAELFLWRTNPPPPNAHSVLFRAVTSLGDAGQASAARIEAQKLVHTATRRFGPAHHQTLTAREQLAHWRGEAGDAAGAAEAFEQLVPDRNRVQGPDHPDILAARAQLARWRGEAGDPSLAETAYTDLLAARKRVLGADHPDTLTARHELARWRGEAGDAAGAAEAFESLVADRERVQGADHPDTLAARAGQADWQGEAGDAAGAAEAFEQLLPDRERIQGPDHPATLTARHELARWRGEAGDAASAAEAFEQLLPDRERVQGADHPDTLAARASLAYWRGEAGDTAGAVSAYEQLVPDRERVLGPDHPDTLMDRMYLAHWQGRIGDTTSAVAALADLVQDYLRVLGPNHSGTLAARVQLARFRGESGDARGAAEAFEQLVPDRERVLGPDHPRTLTTRHELARWRGEAGDAAGAVTAYTDLLAAQTRVHGPDHSETLNARHELARWQGEAGDAAGALAGFESIVADRERIQGLDHPHVLAARAQLVHWQGRVGDAVRTAQTYEQLVHDMQRVLGADHLDTLNTRGNLAYWRGSGRFLSKNPRPLAPDDPHCASERCMGPCS
ncbi:FxSxx-COOH system tetratricopeptide repeat protein [Streptomyces chartreusis]